MGGQGTSNPISFSEATKVERLDSHTYRANLVDSFCIGTGKVTFCLLA